VDFKSSRVYLIIRVKFLLNIILNGPPPRQSVAPRQPATPPVQAGSLVVVVFLALQVIYIYLFFSCSSTPALTLDNTCVKDNLLGQAGWL
jgi:hypothetical protein